MEFTEPLKDFGLSEKEAIVYLTGLELGDSSAGEIAIKSNLPRTLVYDLLEKLIVLGLASYSVSENKKIFSMSNPKELLNILERKTQSISSIVPKLNSLRVTNVNKRPKAEIYEGKKSVRTILDNLLEKRNTEILVYGGSKALYDLDPYFIENWHRKRSAMNIKIRRIFEETEEIKDKVKTHKDSAKLTELRFLKGDSNVPTPTIIHEDRVLLFHLEESNYYAVLIEDHEMASSYIQFFERLWKIAKK